MDVSGLLGLNFNRAAGVFVRDERFLERPSLRIEEQRFQEILEPITKIFENDHIYTQYRHVDVPNMFEELHRMCLEAHTKSSRRGCTREERTRLLNTLQSIKEKAEEGVDASGMRAADMDFFSLPDLTDVIREAADIQRETLHNDYIADALNNVANNIETGHKRLRRPQATLPKFGMADDYHHEQQNRPQSTDTPLDIKVSPDNDYADDYDPLEGMNVA